MDVCFNPAIPKVNSGWASSSSHTLYTFIYNEIVVPLAEGIELPNYSKDNFLWEFKLQIKNQLYIHAGNSPIIWKTTPSRKNSNVGQFMEVKIGNDILPTHKRKYSSTSLLDNMPLRKDKKIRNNFWQTYMIDFKKNSLRFCMNLRHFLIHVMVYKKHGSLNLDNYAVESLTLILTSPEFEMLGLLTWFDEDEDEFKNVAKAAKKNCIDEIKRDQIISKCQGFTINKFFDITTFETMIFTDLNEILFSNSSPEIVQYISELRGT